MADGWPRATPPTRDVRAPFDDDDDGGGGMVVICSGAAEHLHLGDYLGEDPEKGLGRELPGQPEENPKPYFN